MDPCLRRDDISGKFHLSATSRSMQGGAGGGLVIKFIFTALDLNVNYPSKINHPI
jgi:hypothetical protein